MKKLLIAAAICGLFFTFKSTASATQCNGRDCDDVAGSECLQGEHLYNPHCTPDVTVSPTMTATATPVVQCTPTYDPTNTPSPTIQPSPTGDAGSTPTPTPTREPETVLRTDLTDNRSDGLGCSVHDCSQNSNPQPQGPTPQILPATGQDTLIWKVIIGVVGILVGWKFRGMGRDI